MAKFDGPLLRFAWQQVLLPLWTLSLFVARSSFVKGRSPVSFADIDTGRTYFKSTRLIAGRGEPPQVGQHISVSVALASTTRARQTRYRMVKQL